MIRVRTLSSLAAAALAFAALAAPAFAEGDFIERKKGGFIPTVNGDEPTTEDYGSSNYKVSEANLKEIKYQIAKVPGVQKFKSVDARDIWIRPSEYPKAWSDAEAAMNGGDAMTAGRTYRAIGDHKSVHNVIRQKALIRFARAAAAVSLNEGVSAYNYVLTAFPDCFYAKTALKELVGLYMAAGNDKAALETIERMLKLPGVTASDKLEADVLRTSLRYGKAVLAKDTSELRRVLDEYKRLAGSTSGKPDLHDAHVEALLGQGNCLLHLGEVKQARSIFEPLSADDDAADNVLAGAFNGLGECWFSQGDREGYAEARRCFLRTSIMYKDGTASDELARALVFTAECFIKLQDSEDWNTRARNELGECIRRFPNSVWTKRAESVRRGMPKAQ